MRSFGLCLLCSREAGRTTPPCHPLGVGVGKLLGLAWRLASLVAVGNARCGNSAMAAVASVVRTDRHELARAAGLPAVVGMSMGLCLPAAVPVFSLSNAQYGLLAGRPPPRARRRICSPSSSWIFLLSSPAATWPHPPSGPPRPPHHGPPLDPMGDGRGEAGGRWRLCVRWGQRWKSRLRARWGAGGYEPDAHRRSWAPGRGDLQQRWHRGRAPVP